MRLLLPATHGEGRAGLPRHVRTAAARTLQQIVPVATLGLCLVEWPRETTTQPPRA
jgi:hypothetical protein